MIRTIEEATGLPVYPFLSHVQGEGIVYTIEPQSDDGIKQQERLTIRIVADTLAKGREYSTMVKNCLLTVGDKPRKSLGILECHLNGGGSLKDEQTKMTHIILYFYVTRISEVNYNGY